MTAAVLKSTAAFSKWMFAWPAFLDGRNASAHRKLIFTCPFSPLMGKRVSMLASDL